MSYPDLSGTQASFPKRGAKVIGIFIPATLGEKYFFASNLTCLPFKEPPFSNGAANVYLDF
jgi:hypothetical protein